MNPSANSTEQPPTIAKVVLQTTYGELDLELWARETPLACRNFIQLCLEGYYDNTIFHRIISGFMAQGGDPTGTGHSGQSIYNAPFKDQFHLRLKFNKRGLIAMANSGKNDNRSQFFITFAECNHLNKKHTIFGKVVGNTIYNLMAMQSVDTGVDDRPIDPLYIRKTRVIRSFFEDIIPRKQQIRGQQPKELTIKEVSEVKQKKEKSKKQELKGLKNKNRLTFDMEQQQDNRIISSHDVLQDGRLSKKVALTQEEVINKKKQREEEQNKVKEVKERVSEVKKEHIQQNGQIEQILNEEMHRKRQNYQQTHQDTQIDDEVLNYQKKYNPNTQKLQITWEEHKELKEQQKMELIKQQQLQEYEKLRINELNFKKSQEGTIREKEKVKMGQNKGLLSNLQRRRYDYLKKSQSEKHSEDILGKLQNFRYRLQDGPQWMQHRLKFHIDSKNAYKLQNHKKAPHQLQNLDDGGLKVEFSQDNQHPQLSINDLMRIVKQQ